MIRSLCRTAKRAFWLLVALPVACWAQAPTATTPSGPVQGRVVDDVAVFRGIPFAAPPVGDLRWREPQPLPAWSEIRQSVSNAPSCPQKRGLMLEGGGDPGKLDEDCLHLNVFTHDQITMLGPNDKAANCSVGAFRVMS